MQKKAALATWASVGLALLVVVLADKATGNRLDIFTTGALLCVWVYSGVALFKPETFRDLFKSRYSEEERTILAQATHAADAVISVSKEPITPMERAQLIQENYWKIKGEKENEEKTSV